MATRVFTRLNVEQLEDRNLPSTVVATYRDSLNTVAGLTAFTFPMASYLLHHSLQDQPNDVNLNNPTGDLSSQSANLYLNEIEGSPLLTSYLNGKADSSPVGHSIGSAQDFTFSGFNDMHFGLNKVSISWVCDKSSTGFATMSVTIQDRYDFQDATLQFNSINSIISTALNKVGANAQSVGAVVPYNFQATFSVTLPTHGVSQYQVGSSTVVTVGGDPYLCSVASSGKVTAVDLDSGTQRTFNVSLGSSWSAQQVGDYLCIYSPGGTTVTVLGLAAGTQKTYSVGGWNSVQTVGDYLCFYTLGGSLTAVNVASGVTRSYSVGGWSLVQGGDHYLSFVASSGRVTAVDLDAGTQRTYTVNGWNSVQQVGDVLCFYTLGGSNLIAINLAAATQQTYSVGGWNSVQQVGDYLCFYTLNGSLTAVNLLVGTQKSYSVGGWTVVQGNDHYLCFVASSGRVTAVDLDGGTVRTYNLSLGSVWSVRQVGDYLCIYSPGGSTFAALNLVTGIQKAYAVGSWNSVQQVGDYLCFYTLAGSLAAVDLDA